MALEAIEPRRLYRQVAEQLRAYIDSGDCPVGFRLPTERELAEKLNVSRPTIREALIALEVEGRVRIRVGSGIYVCEPAVSAPLQRMEHEGPFEVLSARSFIEGAIAAEAASRIEPAHVVRLDAILLSMEEAKHSTNQSLGLDRTFHCLIAGMLGNAVIERFVRELFDLRMSPYFGRLAAYFEDAESWHEALQEHRAIRDALVAGDPILAREAMHTHLERSAERFSRSFGEGEGAEEPQRRKLPISG